MKMFRLGALLLLLVGPALVVSGQKVIYTINADSTKLTGCDSNELIIENHTQNVKGFLFNTGNGRTIFQRGAIKIDETSYLIGSDTLRLGGYGDSNVYYVNKRYTGPARAVISGNTLASVSSINTSYNNQLSKAAPGSPLSCYPDPFSARNAALDAIAAGRITHAQIVILEGNQYTIGSTDSSKNGSSDGLHPNNGTVADIQFSNVAPGSDTTVTSIMKNGVDMYFCTATNLTYINSSGPIYGVFVNTNTNFTSNIYGLGTFYQVYGEVNGFNAAFYKISNRNSVTSFHAREARLQQWSCFNTESFSICNIEIEDLLTADANVFAIGAEIRGGGSMLGSAANAPEILHVKLKNWKYGKNQIPYPTSTDIWYGIRVSQNMWLEGTEATIDIGNMYMYSTDLAPLFVVTTNVALYNLRLTVNIDNLVQKDAHLSYQGTVGGLINCYNSNIAVNNCITYNIKSGTIEAPLLGWMNFSLVAGSRNNRFYINAGDIRKDSSAFTGGMFNLSSQYAAVAEPMLISIKGNFKSYDQYPMIYATNSSSNYPFANKYVFSGRYDMAHSGLPIAHFYTNTGKILAFEDATLINDGTTPSIMADSLCANFSCNCCQNNTPLNIPVYIKNVHANAAPTANIQQTGDTVKVVADLADFFIW